MADLASPPASNSPTNQAEWLAERARLNKIIQVLMDRAERISNAQDSDFSMFQSTIILEDQVRLRTAELQSALQENEKITRALKESEARFRGLVSQSLVGIVLIEDGVFTYSNAKFSEMFGYAADEIDGTTPLEVVADEDQARVADLISRRLNGEVDRVSYVFRGLRKDGGTLDVECHSSVMHIGERSVLISLLMDISERTRAEREVRVLEDRLRDQSTHDALTGLYNRRFLDESFDRELLVAAQVERPVSVIMGDLDHFKDVNDRAGHLAGDQVLRFLGTLMTEHSRASDLACRYGGEEFLLVLPGMSRDRAIERAEQLRSALVTTRIDIGSGEITVTASFGVATFPRDGTTSDELIAAADAAMYAAKAAGRNCVQGSLVPGPRTERLARGQVTAVT